MPETLACETGTPAICTHRAKGQHPAALFPWREHEWAQPSRGDGFSLGPRTYGATRPVWHCGLPATVRKLPGTQIGACIMELMRVSIRHHLHSVWNPRAARAIQVYRQEKGKAMGTFERCGGRGGRWSWLFPTEGRFDSALPQIPPVLLAAGKTAPAGRGIPEIWRTRNVGRFESGRRRPI